VGEQDAVSELGRRLITARIGDVAYPIRLGAGAIAELETVWPASITGDGVLLAFDENVAHVADQVAVAVEGAGKRVVRAPVPPGEPSKSLAGVERLCRLAARAGIRRRDAVVAVGGGVLGDLAGFVAAAYQRGIGLVHVPTTLLAMVDSSVGGKTGVDLPEGKNYVGAIWQPDMVVMDTTTLASLPQRELSCGFAEVIKYGLLDGPDLFALVEGWPDLPGPPDALVDLIERCVEHKLGVVAADERDLGVRATLNLGHTIGHGIEAAAGYARYRHGEAISLGLLAALRISSRLTGLSDRWRQRTRAVIARHGLPVRLDPAVGTAEILDAARRDKKSDGRALNMVVLRDVGAPSINADPGEDLVVAAIEELRE
jgi:3-dehydroquinate synthase